ncbi:MAG: aldo/keto reductase [Sedimentisphaerales bacterium]|nr:aldo/keto reductase [Sedimentisphaerales bacterium]
MKRRDFLKKSVLAAGTVTMSQTIGCYTEKSMDNKSVSTSSNPPRLSRRPYGSTGRELSIIGFGGIVVMNAEQDHANRVVAESVEKGVNYFDVAPSYGDAETKLGPALEPYRKKVFLACKTTERTRAGAARELENSLKTMRTDYFDLYQLHAITDLEKDVDAVFAKGGAMEVFIEAQKSGRVRHLGFSAHSVEAALAAMDSYDFDSILFPINFATFYQGNFGPRVIARAQQKGMACLALKALARQKWPNNDPLREKYPKCWYQPVTDPFEAEQALRFTLSQPVTAAIPPGEESLFRLAIDLAMNFKPLTPEQNNSLKTLAGDLDPIFSAANKQT